MHELHSPSEVDEILRKRDPDPEARELTRRALFPSSLRKAAGSTPETDPLTRAKSLLSELSKALDQIKTK